MLNRAEEKIFAVHDQRSTDQVTSMHDVLLEAFEQIDARLEHGGATGMPTGFTDLDNLTGGLHDSELVILAARPSMGKTALATNIADHVAIEANVGHAVRQPGNVAAGAGPADALCAGRDRRPASSAAAISPARTARSWSRPRPS